ncbi:MAG: rhomboid family intramembrane serine protease [Rhodospirillales bacterium]|nr:rhomboid family intramembrane serine protease [Rhodospirillales bacterium]
MAILPLRDDIDLKVINFQYVTVGIIITCVAVFLWQLSLGPEQEKAIYQFGTIPAVLFGTVKMPSELAIIPSFLTLFTSVFFHGGWMHLIFNMLFLWVFGDNVEDSMGHLKYLLFFLVCGALAALTHAILESGSTTPLIGASGAISGVLGAYLVLHPKARLLVLFMNIIPLRLPAAVVLIGWIGLQFWSLSSGDKSNTAWWAHIGGFALGMILIVFFRRKSVPLFDGIGRYKPADLSFVESAELKHQKSIFPNTVRIDPKSYKPDDTRNS